MTSGPQNTGATLQKDIDDVRKLAASCGRGRLTQGLTAIGCLAVLGMALILPVPQGPTALLGGFADELVRVVFAVLGVIGVVLLFWQPGKDLANVRAWSGGRIISAEVKTIVYPALQNLDKTMLASKGIESAEIRSKIESVVTAATRLIAGFKNDPDDVHRSRSVLSRLLPSVLDIAETFPELERRSTSPSALESVTKSTSETLVMISETLQKRDEDNLADNYQRVSVELATLHRLADVAAPTSRIMPE